VLFEDSTYKYTLSMLTPAPSASAEVYDANTNAMGAVMATLQPR
jgi:hypothetical protein